MFATVAAGARPIVEPSASAVQLRDAIGNVQVASFHSVSVEERGPLRACVRLDGRVQWSDGVLEVTARLHFYQGSAVAKIVLTMRNPSAAAHPAGYWELGQEGSVYVKDVSVVFQLADRGHDRDLRWSLEAGSEFVSVATPATVHQDSSGGENWRSTTHVNRSGDVPISFQGYRWRAGDRAGEGVHATPIVDVRWGSRKFAVMLEKFWQNFPKSLSVNADEIRVGLWPEQFSDLHEIQGGEQKTHTLFVAFGEDRVGVEPLEWCRAPVSVQPSAEWMCSSGVVPFLVPAAADPHPLYLQLVTEAIDGPNSFYAKREIIDEYGWRNFGDLYADHEAVRHAGPTPIVSHYNNQYDPIAAFAMHFMRTGDQRWKELGDDLAAHVADIDIYHTQSDRSAYNGGLFWHTAHYVDAGRSTHRGYPKAPGVWGGGPASEHDYSTGLMLQYFLTGDERYREAVLGLAQWVRDLDDGSKTPFRWLARGDTGWASMTAVPEYQGPGRGCAYSIQTMLNAFQLTGERGHLHKAEQLVARCIHPHDDIDARNLLDHERRWSYTVFLQTLGRYLIVKAERGELDRAYRYAFEALLAYARWMHDHERPYLDSLDQIEFANETWVAQDIRKSEVFQFAAMCAEGEERARFLDKAEFFFDYATRTLSTFDSRTLTRPLVLMLANGYAWAGAKVHHLP
ncbi:MAG: hypothetical protein ACRD1V_05270, partial [Vicinamibacterales bacterium]